MPIVNSGDSKTPSLVTNLSRFVAIGGGTETSQYKMVLDILLQVSDSCPSEQIATIPSGDSDMDAAIMDKNKS